jgi:WD40 repeat protein
MNRLALIIFLSINLFAIENLIPNKIYRTTGTVQSILFENNILYAGTDNGTVEIFDKKSTNKLKTIKIPDIKDFMGDTIPSKIYSIDMLENNLLIVSQGMKGYRNIFLYKNDKLNKIIGIDKKYFIQKASFISNNEIIFALLSNQIGVYNFKNKKLKYLIQISASSFSHFMISEDKKTLATTDESGMVRLLNINSGQIIEQTKNQNLDKVYQLDYKNGIILTAGQDRKAIVYNKNSFYKMEFDFLLYSCGLSPTAKLGAIAYNEKNEVLVFDIESKRKIYNLKDQKATLTQILFINENELFTSSDDSNINYFKLKE